MTTIKPFVFIAFLLFSFALQTTDLSAQATYHRVVRGETLYSIARQYNVSVADLMQVNNIKDPGLLQLGANLLIPGTQPAGTQAQAAASPAVTYTVKRGDTLFGIARTYGIGVDELRTANNLRSDTIVPGQDLKIPGKQGSVATAAPASGGAGGGSGSTTAATSSAGSGGSASSGSTTGTGGSTSTTATTVSVVPQSGDYFWPVQGPLTVLQGKLQGMAIQAGAGSSVRAVRAGTVVSVGPFRGFGNVAFVQASDGLMYVYGGLGLITVKAGDSVRKSHQLGLLSSEPEPSAYFFVFRGADTIDPAKAPRD